MQGVAAGPGLVRFQSARLVLWPVFRAGAGRTAAVAGSGQKTCCTGVTMTAAGQRTRPWRSAKCPVWRCHNPVYLAHGKRTDVSLKAFVFAQCENSGNIIIEL